MTKSQIPRHANSQTIPRAGMIDDDLESISTSSFDYESDCFTDLNNDNLGDTVQDDSNVGLEADMNAIGSEDGDDEELDSLEGSHISCSTDESDAEDELQMVCPLVLLRLMSRKDFDHQLLRLQLILPGSSDIVNDFTMSMERFACQCPEH